MRHFIFILFLLAASICLGLVVAEYPSYVFITFQQSVIQLPLWFAAIVLLIAFLILYGLLRFFAFFHQINYNVKHWWRALRRNKAYDRTQRGLLELWEENWAIAERHLIDGIDQTKNSVINYLGAAVAANAEKAFDRAGRYFQKAHQLVPTDEVVVGLMEVKMQLEQGQLEQALAHLTRLRQMSPYHPTVLKLLEKIYIRLGEWQSLLELLPFMRKAKIITQAQYLIFEENVYVEMLNDAEPKKLSIHAVRELWHGIPEKMRAHSKILGKYASLLKADKNSAAEIEPLIRKVLQKEWNDELGNVYASLTLDEPMQQLTFAETWIKRHGNIANFYLTLGRLAMRCQLWGKAKQYLEEGLKQEPNSEMEFELATLFEQLGDTPLALKHYKSAYTSENKHAHI